MSAKDNGGSAYPHKEKILDHNAYPSPEYFEVAHKGMTLRDYFAGQALVGLAIAFKDTTHVDHLVADIAYRFADAMIEERSQ